MFEQPNPLPSSALSRLRLAERDGPLDAATADSFRRLARSTTQRRRRASSIRPQTDPLTGLFNHRIFHERLRVELTRASRERGSVALVMLDLDDFKRVNDIHSHAVGDEALEKLADLIRATARGYDVVCRVGGEEFARSSRSRRRAGRCGRRPAPSSTRGSSMRSCRCRTRRSSRVRTCR
jgi:PleD family two-component response regulator